VLRRFRQTARRWPGLSLALVLLAFTSQSLATTFDWCLHGGEGAHVANGLAPCDGEGEPGAARDVGPDVLDATPGAAAVAPVPCHGAHAGGAMPAMHHVAAASDGAFTPASTLAAMPVFAHWQFLPWVLALESSGKPAPTPSHRGPRFEAGRPTLSDAVPGQSSRLLI
jgi:hypothetical protein